MYNTYLKRGDSIYKQARGVIMGTSCSPPVGNIYVATSIEGCTKLRSASVGLAGPVHYFRLKDDGLFIWEGDADSLARCIRILSTIRPTIKLVVASDSCSLSYLDVVISKGMSAPGATVPLNSYISRTSLTIGSICSKLLFVVPTGLVSGLSDMLSPKAHRQGFSN